MLLVLERREPLLAAVYGLLIAAALLAGRAVVRRLVGGHRGRDFALFIISPTNCIIIVFSLALGCVRDVLQNGRETTSTGG